MCHKDAPNEGRVAQYAYTTIELIYYAYYTYTYL